MKIDELISTAKDSVTARKVYAEPYEKDGTTVITAARVSGGAGAGNGTDEAGQQGEGGGIGLNARPSGAYVIKDGAVRWLPALDVNRLITAVTAVAVTLLVTLSRLRRARRTDEG